MKAKILITKDQALKFLKAHSLPFVRTDKVDKEWLKMDTKVIIEVVKFTDWAAMVIPVLKPVICLYGNYKLMVNQVTKL